MNHKAIENITAIMQALTTLPEDEFDEALVAAATLVNCTIKARRGRRFLKDFMQAAINDEGSQPVLVWQGRAH